VGHVVINERGIEELNESRGERRVGPYWLCAGAKECGRKVGSRPAENRGAGKAREIAKNAADDSAGPPKWAARIRRTEKEGVTAGDKN
jgi:hypothetical protein